MSRSVKVLIILLLLALCIPLSDILYGILRRVKAERQGGSTMTLKVTSSAFEHTGMIPSR